jgi:hypothetical protein
MFAVTLLSRPESLRRGLQLQGSRADASVDQVTRAGRRRQYRDGRRTGRVHHAGEPSGAIGPPCPDTAV